MRVNVYAKKQIRLNMLSFGQRQMFKLGNVGLASRKNDAVRAITPSGSGAKPLTRKYAIRKTRIGRGNRRNLTLSGDMLREWSVRSVSENQANATWSTRKGRTRARANQAIEEFVSWSRNDAAAVKRAAEILVQEAIPRMLIERQTGLKT